MNVYYSRFVDRYPSKLTDGEDFRTAEQARSHDRETAIALVASTPPDELRLALRLSAGRSDLKRALAYLAAEIDADGPAEAP